MKTENNFENTPRLVFDEFDSSVLGIRVYKLQIESQLEESFLAFLISKGKPDMIVCFTVYDPDNLSLLNKYEFTYVTSRFTYSQRLGNKNISKCPTGTQIRKLSDCKNKAPQLIELGLQLVEHTRFAKDSQISLNLANQIVKNWIFNSIKCGFSDEVISIWISDRPVGLVTLKKRNQFGYIDFIVVDNRYKGKGIGSILIQQSFKYFQDQQIERVYVNTEAENIAAHRFYQKMSFIATDYRLVFHQHNFKGIIQ